MRISDWSSDVCSSDLVGGHTVEQAAADEEAVLIALHGEAAAVYRQLRALLYTAVDQALHAVARGRGHQRAHVDVVARGVGADLQAFDPRHPALEQAVGRLLADRSEAHTSDLTTP